MSTQHVEDLGSGIRLTVDGESRGLQEGADGEGEASVDALVETVRKRLDVETVEEIRGPFREEVEAVLRVRLADGWRSDRLLDHRRDLLRRAVDRFGRSPAFALAVRVVDHEIAHAAEEYPREDDPDGGA